MNKIKKVVLVALVIISILVPSTYLFGNKSGYYAGFEDGYVRALTDISDQIGIDFEWEDLGEGRYKVSVISEETGLYAEGEVEVHLTLRHWRDGVLLSEGYGAGVLTNIGKDWIEQQIAASDGTQEALYCADSNDAGAPSAAWTELPNEIAANGLDRQTGAYASTGVGTFTVTVLKSVTGVQSTQLWGLHWIVTDETDNNLLCSDSGPAQKNCENGDTLEEVWELTVS